LEVAQLAAWFRRRAHKANQLGMNSDRFEQIADDICGWLEKKRAAPLDAARHDESTGAPPLACTVCHNETENLNALRTRLAEVEGERDDARIERDRLELLLGYSREGVRHWTKNAERLMNERDAAIADRDRLAAENERLVGERDAAKLAVARQLPWEHLGKVEFEAERLRAERETAEAIALWMETRLDRSLAISPEAGKLFARAVRAGAWRTP
jgi:hypothetical protein